MRGALRVITPMASQASGQLVDSLPDRRRHPLIRRRLPILHPDILDLCFDALEGSDPGSRGTALEYLDNLLSDELKVLLWKHLAAPADIAKSKRSLSEIAGDLRRALPARREGRG